jgi:hypothetical protein
MLCTTDTATVHTLRARRRADGAANRAACGGAVHHGDATVHALSPGAPEN